MGEAFDNFKSGKIKDGFKSLLKAGLSLIPGVGSVIAWLMDDKMEEPKAEGAGTTEKFDASTIYKAITDGVKDKFKTILKNIKKLPFVPNVVVDKIASYLDIDIGDKAKPEAKIESKPEVNQEATNNLAKNTNTNAFIELNIENSEDYALVTDVK